MIRCTLCGGEHPRSRCPWPTVDEVTAARDALADYNRAYEAGGELDYPHWADEIVRVHKMQNAPEGARTVQVVD